MRMAVAMRGRMADLVGGWRRRGHDLGFGVGIARGYATLGTIGFEGRYDYGAIGTAVNLASRLCDEAQPGQILVSSATRERLGPDTEVLRHLGERALQGRNATTSVFEVAA